MERNFAQAIFSKRIRGQELGKSPRSRYFRTLLAQKLLLHP